MTHPKSQEWRIVRGTIHCHVQTCSASRDTPLPSNMTTAAPHHGTAFKTSDGDGQHDTLVAAPRSKQYFRRPRARAALAFSVRGVPELYSPMTHTDRDAAEGRSHHKVRPTGQCYSPPRHTREKKMNRQTCSNTNTTPTQTTCNI